MIVDDYFADNSLEKINSSLNKLKDSRFRLVHQENLGVASARNQALSRLRSNMCLLQTVMLDLSVIC
ncbi:glycosyltransferase family A protein [Lacticaseibacillus hulanensis]|uniref:glycosyltransferase family A protein n=1 Tax=Lacticaseibacillus hulanensis TaxID=2493111 RepID=UPI000FD8B382